MYTQWRNIVWIPLYIPDMRYPKFCIATNDDTHCASYIMTPIAVYMHICAYVFRDILVGAMIKLRLKKLMVAAAGQA